jgi:hypothetical protein
MNKKLLQEYFAVALYRGDQLDGDRHPGIYAFFKKLDHWQRDQILVVEREDAHPSDVSLHFFTPFHRIEVDIEYDGDTHTRGEILASAFARTQQARETWGSARHVWEGRLTINDLRNIFLVMSFVESDPISDAFFENETLSNDDE